jgi:3-hydroxybutyryl-CoA dehydrogenase
MKIAVLASGVLKEEMKQKFVGNDVNIVWADSIFELTAIKDAEAYFDLDFFYEEERIKALKKLLPASVFINSVVDALKKINQPFIRINAWPGFLQRPICEVSVLDEEQKKSPQSIFDQLNWQFRFVPDVPGMVTPRILAMIVNEAYYTLQDEVSTKEEIDIAMQLGTNYPYGPFEWGRRIGLKKIYDLLIELSKAETVYKVSEMLEEEAKNKG